MGRVVLALDGVSKSYRVGSRIVGVLEDVSLHAREGEFVAIVGPSGCGKSTLFRLVSGLLEPDRGEILLDGGPTRRLGRCAYMFQSDLLFPWRRLLDNVILALELAGVGRRQCREEARALLPLFGLDGFERAYPSELSGGMRQRAALLRSFLAHRDLLLLDEPFGALDALTRAELQSWLLDVWQRFRQTILFVTHDVEEAVLLADRIYVLSPRPGRIKEEVAIALPRPRHRGMVGLPEFARLRESLLNSLMLGAGPIHD